MPTLQEARSQHLDADWCWLRSGDGRLTGTASSSISSSRIGSIDCGPASTDITTYPHAGTATEALRQLDDAHDLWVEGVRGLGHAGLARPQGPTVPAEFADAPMARLVLYTSLEVIHHGAEICLLRDLCLRSRS
jgi:hypothetical protein